MSKRWLGICILSLLLVACESTSRKTSPLSSAVQTGSTLDVDGVKPRYEPYNVGTSLAYRHQGKVYRIVTRPESFSETGIASIYRNKPTGELTALGEAFNPNELTAAHPTLPLPSYVRVTNLNNGRQLIVRINDRGPFMDGHIIELTKTAADRLNLTPQTNVQIDAIVVASDGRLYGPGTARTMIARQSYALPEPPDIAPPTLNETTDTKLASTISSSPSLTTRSNSNAALPTVRQNNQAVTPATPANRDNQFVNTRATPPTTVPEAGYMIQVMAVADRQFAEQSQQRLSNALNVPGKITTVGALYRVRLGPVSTRQQARQLQRQLVNHGITESFMIKAP